MPTPLAVIGDVHGCVEELEMLFIHINKTYGNHQIILAGDLIDKGPESGKVVEFARSINAIVVLGNHEEKHLRFHKREKEGVNKMGPAKFPEKYEEFWEVRRQLLGLPFDAFEYLSQFKYYHYTDWDAVVIHGGLTPDKRPEDMDPSILCRVRNLDPVTKRMVSLEGISEDTPVWPHFFDAQKTFGNPFYQVIYGHSPYLKPFYLNGATCIDTGCVHGNKLTAYLWPEQHYASVDAQKAYAPLGFPLWEGY